jgi:hypothetical protein
LYNLLVSAEDRQWTKSAWELELGRSVREFTDDALVRKYQKLDAAAIAELLTFPCIFGYEDFIKKSARIGWLTAIKVRGQLVRVEYQLEKNLPPISVAKLKKLKLELDIRNWELNRTHWAVKDIDLLSVLLKGKVLRERDLGDRGRDSRLVRFGLDRTINEISIKPTVFRVPAVTAVEIDLVSAMMPFDAGYSSVYAAIKSACKEAKLRCERADSIWQHAEVIQDIFSLIYRSRVVVCDFSGRNPNVFYEAGIAHTLGKVVIPIVQNDTDIPFDLRHIRYIKYLNNGEGLSKLSAALAEKLRTLA